MGKLLKKDTIKRWQTSEGQHQRQQVIYCLANNLPIEKLSFIEQLNGYIDLRGITFDNKTMLSKAHIKDVDFSYANFNYILFDECRIVNTLFNMCDCTEMLQYNCYFERCKFVKSKMLNAGFGIDGGQYKDIQFEDSNLKGSMFFYPDFSDCIFKNCMLEGVDFSASHFNNVRFIGRLDDVWFRGKSPRPSIQKAVQEKGRGLNPMNVDFSDADLWYITYSDNCDLSKVLLPKDGCHYLINNIKKVIDFLEADALRMAENSTEKFIKEFIEMYKYHIAQQDMVIINIKNVISNAENYMGKDSECFCKAFVEQLITLSNS